MSSRASKCLAFVVLCCGVQIASAPRPTHARDDEDDLLVSNVDRDRVERYDAGTGAFVDIFAAKHLGGMNQPLGVLFGPHDHDVYVGTGIFGGPGQTKAVLRYDGDTGAFLGEFTYGTELESPRGIIFGPDGDLFVIDRASHDVGRICRFDGWTGEYLEDFVPYNDTFFMFTSLVFFESVEDAGRLDLYASSVRTGSVSRFDGETGELLGAFVAPGSAGLNSPHGLTFGPDGDLYVASAPWGGNPGVWRFRGPSADAPGAFVEVFLPGVKANWLIFGPNGDLYVTEADIAGGSLNAKNGRIGRYDGSTGDFLDYLVPPGGELVAPGGLTFEGTDPVTLRYVDFTD